ncbi:hypothetical protein pb186bvf_020536 [Paramecium bursaria]
MTIILVIILFDYFILISWLNKYSLINLEYIQVKYKIQFYKSLETIRFYLHNLEVLLILQHQVTIHRLLDFQSFKKSKLLYSYQGHIFKISIQNIKSYKLKHDDIQSELKQLILFQKDMTKEVISLEQIQMEETYLRNEQINQLNNHPKS